MSRAGLRTLRFGLALGVSTSLLLLPASSPASSVRVRPEYFGVNFQNVDKLDAAARKAQLKQIAALRIPTIRINLSWQVVEPSPHAQGNAYQWQRYDAIFGDAARHGIRVTPTIVQSPSWNTPNDLATETRCNGAQSQRPLNIQPYVALAREVALRYGVGGSFWRAHPELAAAPIREYEIWNEQNLRGGWCPAPDAQAYAAMFAGAADAIHAIDPAAKVIVGGVAEPVPGLSEGAPVGHYLAAATAAHPEITRQAAGVAIHGYPQPTSGGLLYKLIIFRAFLRAGGIPNSTPMIVNEIGWPTQGSPGALDEARRAKGYTALTKTIPRSNCNVSAVLPHTWLTAQSDPATPEDWFGIADPVTGAPSASASAYAAGIRVQRGKTKREAKRKTIKACKGMPLPDQDTEGVVDQRDYFPLNPRHAARKTKKGLPAVECSVRLTAARAAIGSGAAADVRRLRRAYRRLSKRCMPCNRKTVRALRRLEHKILAGKPSRRVKLRTKHVAQIKSCLTGRG